MAVPANDLIEVLCSTHLSSFVDSPYEDRGGVMLVGGPGALKTTFLKVVDATYHDAIAMSDVNAKTMNALKESFANEQLRTIVLPEFGKIYERIEATAANVEGILRAMAAEGFYHASFDDQRRQSVVARATVMGAMTSATYNKRFTGWDESGFSRRFLWAVFMLDRPDVLENAALENRLLKLCFAVAPRPPLDGARIPFSVLPLEKLELRNIVKYQPGGSHTIHLQLLMKVLSVLRYWYAYIGERRDAMDTIRSVAPLFGKHGGKVSLPQESKPHRQIARAKPAKHKPVKRSKRKPTPKRKGVKR